MTDGQYNYGNDGVLINATKIFKERNISIFVIGIGDEVWEKQLRLLVDNEDDVYMAKQFDELKKIVKEASRCRGNKI